MSFVSLRHVAKAFGAGPRRRTVFRELDLSIDEGEFVVVLGFSGAGKTTLVNLVAGLLAPDAGTVAVGGTQVLGAGPDRGVVFQNYALLPWLTVRENVGLAVEARFPAWTPARRARRVEEQLELVGLAAAAERRPPQLSGGMRQRVAVARALALNPRVLLLDEPLSALDAPTRDGLRREIESIWAADRKTVLMISNDVDEALLLADRILPLGPGPDARFGPAVNVSLPRPREPKSLIRDPEFNRLRAAITAWLLEAAAQRRCA